MSLPPSSKRWCVASPEVEFELVGPCSMNAVLRPYSTELLRYAPEWEGELPDIWRGGGGRNDTLRSHDGGRFGGDGATS